MTVGGYTGNVGDFTDSYRYSLFNALKQNNAPAFEFVGHIGGTFNANNLFGWGGNPPAGSGLTSFPHSGTGLISIGETLSKLDTFLVPQPWGPVDPDVVVVNLGTNGNPAQFPGTITQLVQALKNKFPNSVIVVGTIPANQNELTSVSGAERTAGRVEAQSLAADRVFVSDVYSRMKNGASAVVAADFADPTHFRATGGTKFGAALLPEVLRAVQLSKSSRCGTHSGVTGGTGGGTGVTPDSDGNYVVFDGATGGIKTGYVADIAAPVTSGVAAQLNYTFSGPSLTSTGAVSVAYSSANPVTLAVSVVGNPTPIFVKQIPSSSSTANIHNYPLPGVTGGQKISITLNGAASIQLRRLVVVNRPFVVVEAPTAVSSGLPVTIQIGLPWQPARLRLQKAGDPTDCAVCGQIIDVTQGGGYTFAAPTPGLWKAVLFTNTPGETIGISDTFVVRQPAPPTNGTSIYAYRDGFQTGWENWSWAANAPASTPAVGAVSLSFEPDDWKGVIFHASQLPTSATHLRFRAARAGAAGGSVSLRATVLSNKTVLLDQFFVVTNTALTEFSWPLSLPASTGSAVDIQIQGYAAGNQDTSFVDEVELTNGTPPPTTVPPVTTTTLPPTTTTTTPPVTTTTVAPVTTTTLPPIPAFTGAPAQSGLGFVNAFPVGQPQCLNSAASDGTLASKPSLNIPPSVWASSTITFSGSPAAVNNISVTVQYVNTAGKIDLVPLPITSKTQPLYLPNVPVGTRWVTGYTAQLTMCLDGPGTKNWQIGPFLAGPGSPTTTTVPPTTTPGTTTPTVPVTTTPPPPPGPDFSKVPNYLKSDYSLTRASGTECLGYSGSAQVVVSACDTAPGTTRTFAQQPVRRRRGPNQTAGRKPVPHDQRHARRKHRPSNRRIRSNSRMD